MRARTTRFDAAIASSHQIATGCDVYYNLQRVQSGLKVVSGTVTLDRTAAIMGRCDITLAEPLLAVSATGPLTPYGYEIAPSRGVVYPDGTTELMPLGVFPIQTAEVDGVTLTTTISGFDRSQLVSDARLEDDYAVAQGTNYATAIRDLIDAGVPGLSYQFASTIYTTPALVFAAQADRWQTAQSMAKSIGSELYFDGSGQCVLRGEPMFDGNYQWTFAEGTGGLLVGLKLRQARDQAYNRVIATGENTGNSDVFRGVWTDTDPGSPTYYAGGFGRKPRFYASPLITSNEQAASAATAIGTAQTGIARSLTFEGVPNPALEPGDAILVTRSALNVNEIHLVDSLTLGLAADQSMTGTSRSTAAVIEPAPADPVDTSGGVPATAWTIDDATGWTIDDTTYWETA